MMNYTPIPTKPMDISVNVHITTEPPVPIVSNSFFVNMPNIVPQFNIPHVASQYNITSSEMNNLLKINEGYGLLCEVVLSKFVQERSKYAKISNAFFTRVEVLSICNILTPIQTGETNNHIMYIGEDFHAFTGVIAHMIPRRAIVFTQVASSQLRESGGLEKIISQTTSKNMALIYVDVCASDLVYSHTYVVFLLKTLTIILSEQCKRGSVIIKTNMLIFKPVLDVLYLLSGKYEHMYIVRPFVSEDAYSRFVIFTNLKSNVSSSVIDNLINTANSVNTIAPNQFINSIIDCKMSQYFTAKIEESNLLIGQKYVEKYDSLITLIKTYAKDNRIDYTKSASIARCIAWCDKHNIPTQTPQLT